MPLRLQYGLEEPNSALHWLQRWTSFCLFEPGPQRKKVIDSKTQMRQNGFQNVETEPGRLKPTVRRVPPAYVDNGIVHSTSETEKPKRYLRRGASHPADTMQEHPQNELEKVKRNLRKVSNSTAESNERLEVETAKPNRSLRKASISLAPDAPDKTTGDSAEKMKKDIVATVSEELNVEITSKPLVTDGSVNVLHDNLPPLDLQPLDNMQKDSAILVTNGEVISKEDQTNHDNQKTSRRRASLPAKQENPENGLQNGPTLPSYMAATESAKAKLRGQGSPRLGQDVVEKNGFTRRHSLSSSTNGKLSSLSPRIQRLVQTTGKAGIKNDRSFSSSRDVSEKVVQAEWRR